jgi:hypothetical protein
MRDDWLEVRVAGFCTDERFKGGSIEDYLNDTEPKHPKVTEIGDGRYLSIVWCVERPGSPDEIQITPGFQFSLN